MLICLWIGTVSPDVVNAQSERPSILPDSGFPNGLLLAESYYTAAKQAIDEEEWSTAQSHLDEAAHLIWRADLQAMPRGYIGEWRALRRDIESSRNLVMQYRSEAPSASADNDPGYAEERIYKSGFAELLPMWSATTSYGDYDPPLPDFSRFDIPLTLNGPVKQALFILQNEAAPLFSEWLNRTNLYLPMIKSILSREGLPHDLIYVAMIESGFMPRSYSSDGAAGLWQLMSAQGTHYGLVRTDEIDERFDPEKSTRAVILQFKDLYRSFGSWELVLAAHHAGAASIENAGSGSVWQMNLPRDTAPFIAFVMAAAIISKNPEEYGFEIQAKLPLTFETVPVPREVALDSIAIGMSMPVEQLKVLNPELRRWRALPGYLLKLPVGTQAAYYTWAGIEPATPEPADLTVYRVRRGDSILRIARRFGVRSDDIIVENEITRPDRLRIGQVLYIPTYGTGRSARTKQTTTSTTRSARPVSPPNPETHKKLTYRVRRGDTLERIGRRHGVSIRELQSWNALRDPGDILAGQRLAIWVPATETPEPVADGSTLIYTVRPGDTLWDIARAHNVTVSALRSANGLNRRGSIHPGDKLKINRP